MFGKHLNHTHNRMKRACPLHTRPECQGTWAPRDSWRMSERRRSRARVQFGSDDGLVRVGERRCTGRTVMFERVRVVAEPIERLAPMQLRCPPVRCVRVRLGEFACRGGTENA